MRNKKLVLTICLLVAVLCIGAGFAVVTDVLDISGTANVTAGQAESAFDTHVYFSSAVANRAADGDTVSIPNEKGDKATFSVNSLKGANDSTSFTFTIKNDGDLDAKVTPRLVANDNGDYFSVASDWDGATKDLPAYNSENPSGSEITYTVTVKLLKTPTELQTCNINIELLATSGEETSSNNG